MAVVGVINGAPLIPMLALMCLSTATTTNAPPITLILWLVAASVCVALSISEPYAFTIIIITQMMSCVKGVCIAISDQVVLSIQYRAELITVATTLLTGLVSGFLSESPRMWLLGSYRDIFETVALATIVHTQRVIARK